MVTVVFIVAVVIVRMLVCLLASVPAPTSVEITSGVTTSGGVSTLVITSPDTGDSGEYVCRVENSFGPDESSVMVTFSGEWEWAFCCCFFFVLFSGFLLLLLFFVGFFFFFLVVVVLLGVGDGVFPSLFLFYFLKVSCCCCCCCCCCFNQSDITKTNLLLFLSVLFIHFKITAAKERINEDLKPNVGNETRRKEKRP